jgi:glycosyltransferase involved in cell wall biosynthesis
VKIIIVSDHARIVGGAAKIAILSARAFAERGFDVEFLAGAGPVAKELTEVPSIKVTCLDGIQNNRDPNRLRGALRAFWNGAAANAMREILRRSDPKDTVVHFHVYRDVLTSSVAYVAAKKGFVTVYTAHEYTLGCPYGGFFDYRRNAICPMHGLSMGCLKTKCTTSAYGRKLWYYALQFVYAKILRIPKKLSHTVFISKLNRDVLTRYLPNNARFTIVSNAFDFADSAPAAISEHSPFLFIGALEPHKDPITAARAAKQLGAPITFVGSGSIGEKLKTEHPEATVTGWVGREEVERRILESRALVLPSIWYEAQPGTSMEAAACGLPVIVSDKCAAVEQVEDFGVGEVFEGGNAEDLATKMLPYLDTDFARKQGAATQAAYRKLDLSTDRHIERLLEIYRDELARNSSQTFA